MRTVILAGTYRCAQRVAEAEGLHASEWMYAKTGTLCFLGLRNPTVLVTDCWHERTPWLLRAEVRETLAPMEPNLFRIQCP